MLAATEENGDIKHLPIKGEHRRQQKPEDCRSEATKTMRDRVIVAITNPDLIEVVLFITGCSIAGNLILGFPGVS
jgi:hypothetical protein